MQEKKEPKRVKLQLDNDSAGEEASKRESVDVAPAKAPPARAAHQADKGKGAATARLVVKQEKQTSQLLEKLMAPNTETSEDLQRKVDYFFTPYNPAYNMDKHMKFDDARYRVTVASKATHGNRQDGLAPSAIPKQLAAAKWSRLVNRLFSTDTDALRDLARHVHLQNGGGGDFLTKLDLVEKYPQLFAGKDRQKIELTKEELEVLRAMIIGDKKLFASNP